jgi:hypothetical protein
LNVDRQSERDEANLQWEQTHTVESALRLNSSMRLETQRPEYDRELTALFGNRLTGALPGDESSV